jgi:hypothetical protein
MIWKKYEMSKTKWVELSATIKNEESWDSSKVVALVELGSLVKTPAVLDENGNVITEAVLSTKLSVDILWVEQEPSEFSAYSVNVAAGAEAHQFAGMEWNNS